MVVYYPLYLLLTGISFSKWSLRSRVAKLNILALSYFSSLLTKHFYLSSGSLELCPTLDYNKRYSMTE
jgi:hypothetical protein